jgi:phage gp29-like protein
MTTDNGSSRSQSETHADVRDMVVKADADLICESFNNTVVKWWFEYNQAAFPNAKQPLLYRNTEPKTDLSKIAERDKKISDLGYEPTEEYIKETYGGGWVKKQTTDPVINQNRTPNFAEPSYITVLKNAQNEDQDDIVKAANLFAENYEGILGKRVEQVLNYAEATDDFETMKAHFAELMKELPPNEMVEKVEKANFVAKLLGLFRGQK